MSAIGDTILTLPVACRLRNKFPNAFLAWVVEEKSAAFVKDHAALDEVIVAERGWFTRPRGVLQMRRRLKALSIDAAVDCQGLTKSALACWLSGAKTRIGFAGPHGGELSPWLANRLVRPSMPHVTDRSLQLLGVLGVWHDALQPVQWRLPVEPQASAMAAQWLAQHLPGPFVAVNPGATWDSKLWSMQRFGEVAARLREEHSLPTVVVWGGQREREWAEEIVSSSRGAARLAPSTTLHELAAILQRARLVVSSDTGPMHLAVAAGAPTVGLHGATHPKDCGPYGTPNRGVLKHLQRGGRRERRNADNSAMLAISADDAMVACEHVLGESEATWQATQLAATG